MKKMPRRIESSNGVVTMPQFKRNKTFKDIKPPTSERVRMADLVELVQLPKNGEWVSVRFIGPVASYGYHWITFFSERKKSEITIPKLCLAYDPETESIDSTKQCPYCDLAKLSVEYYVNCIVRSIQEQEPKRISPPTAEEMATGFKDKSSSSWTPVRVLRMPPTLAKKIMKLSVLNRHKDPKTGRVAVYDVSDPKYGCDVYISYDESATGSDKYQVQKGNHSPLTQTEMGYLLWNIEDRLQPESLAEALNEAKFFKGETKKEAVAVGVESNDDEEFDDDDEEIFD